MNTLETQLEQHREWMRGIRTDRLVGTSDKQTSQAIYTDLMEMLNKEHDGYINAHNLDGASAMVQLRAKIAEYCGINNQETK